MAIKKKKPRKKRQPEPIVAPPTEENEKVQFKDEFQTSVGQKIEEIGSKFEGKGRTIIYALSAVAVLLIIAGLFYVWNRRTNNAAQAALGNAIETSQAQISPIDAPAGTDFKTFKTEKERAEAAIAEFQAVIDTYGGSYAEKAKYFIATSRLSIDREVAKKELLDLAQGSGDVALMSKFALAQAFANEGNHAEAEKYYSDLLQAQTAVISKETIRFELAGVYEKQKKTKEAADAYFQIAKEAAEAKDGEGKAIPLTQTAMDAKEKIQELDPERAKQIPEPEPPAGLPLGP